MEILKDASATAIYGSRAGAVEWSWSSQKEGLRAMKLTWMLLPDKQYHKEPDWCVLWRRWISLRIKQIWGWPQVIMWNKMQMPRCHYAAKLQPCRIKLYLLERRGTKQHLSCFLRVSGSAGIHPKTDLKKYTLPLMATSNFWTAKSWEWMWPWSAASTMRILPD